MKRLLVIQHVEREGPGLFAEVAALFNYKIEIYNVDLGDEIPPPDSQDVLLVLGGPMGVKDIDNSEYPWLSYEIDLIRKAVTSNIPFIGVCLGAQLLSYCFGGNVVKLSLAESDIILPEIGWGKISFINNKLSGRFQSYSQNDFHVLHWHLDRILLPDIATLIASSERCNEQMFMIGDKAFGLQFHVEIDNYDFDRWLLEDSDFVSLAYNDKEKELVQRKGQLIEAQSRNIRRAFIIDIFKSFH